jgi:hypothetical protein
MSERPVSSYELLVDADFVFRGQKIKPTKANTRGMMTVGNDTVHAAGTGSVRGACPRPRLRMMSLPRTTPNIPTVLNTIISGGWPGLERLRETPVLPSGTSIRHRSTFNRGFPLVQPSHPAAKTLQPAPTFCRRNSPLWHPLRGSNRVPCPHTQFPPGLFFQGES